MAEPLEELAALLTRPLRTGAEAEPHEQPWRGQSGAALAVALPTSAEEVRRVVLWAREHRVALLPQGAVTGLVGASTPPPDGPATVVLSTDALTSRLDIDADAAVAVVSAGVRLSTFNDAAGRVGLELPIDLAADPAVGAMVATNTGGSRVIRHGDMSTWVLGVRAVMADADASEIGDVRGLRKDNTGPDPTRLLVGSAGAFGVITEVAVALSPLPAERSVALVGPVPDGLAVDLLTALRQALGDRLSAFEVMCPAALAAGLGHVAHPPPVDVGSDPLVTALVEVSGEQGTGDALLEAVVAHDPDLADRALEMPVQDAWAMRHAITDGLRRSGRVLGFDLSVAPRLLPRLRADVRRLVADTDPALVVADFGHWGDGGVHCNIVVPAHVDMGAEREAGLRDAVYSLVVDDLAGSFSAEHGIGPTNAAWWERTTDPATKAVLASMKSVADPLGILGHPGLPF